MNNHTNRLGFRFLPKRREFLEFGIGDRLRREFAYSEYVALPKVHLYTPAQVQAVGGPTNALGWFDFSTEEIVALVFEDKPAAEAWALTTGVLVHEYLHWLWSLSPATVGCQDEPERFVMNCFTDGANEQRAMLALPWARRYLKGTRTLIFARGWANQVDEPLYWAGHATLAAHTLLSVKGGRILRRLHGAAKPESLADEVWQLCERMYNQTIAANWREPFQKAFRLAVKAWTADNDFTRFDLAKEFIDLFPRPQTSPPDSPHDVGGHRNDDKERGDAPAGCDQTGKRLTNGTPGSAQRAAHRAGDPDASSDATATADNEPLALDDPGTANEDSFAGDDDDNDLGKELAELNQPSSNLLGARSSSIPDRLSPADPGALIKLCQPEAILLAERLRIALRPRSREKSLRGRVITRKVAFDPGAAKPFKGKTVAELGFSAEAVIGITVDTSGSMKEKNSSLNSISKEEAARRAAMTVHLACAAEAVTHLVLTSRSLEMAAGPDVAAHRAAPLIASISPPFLGEGDNYTFTLPIAVREIKKRSEKIKILLVLTDGQPCDEDAIKELVADARAGGIIVVGVGLELSNRESSGMQEIFGDKPEQTVLGKSEDFARTTAEVLSNAVTRGARFRS